MLLLVIAVELHLGNRLQATIFAQAALLPTAQPATFRPVATALRQPTTSPEAEMRVRIVGYEERGQKKDFGYGSSNENQIVVANRLPVSLK